ncbi:MAG: PilZ domain-containing protein, partial [Spirochaetota bacterium]
VVGYLYLIRDDTGAPTFSEDAVNFVINFSRVLVYSLKVNGYFKKDERESEYSDSELINISGSGVLFSYPTDGPELRLYAPVDLRIKLDDRVIPAKGRVMRKYKDAGHLYLGVQFLDIETSDMELLFDRIYGETYRGEADDVGLAEISDPEQEDYSTE